MIGFSSVNVSMIWVILAMTRINWKATNSLNSRLAIDGSDHNAKDTPVFYREDDWPKGYVADYILKAVLLDEPRNLKKHMRFVWTDRSGSKNPMNGSYDGAIGLVASSKADAYILPLDYHVIDEQVVQPSSLLHSVNYIIAHPIIEKSRPIGLLSLLELVVPPLELLGTVLGGVLMYLLVLYLLTLCMRRWFRKPKGPSLQTKILAFFFMLFWWFCDELYNSNLSTDQISVDLRGLLHSEERLLNTIRQPCIMDKDGELEIFKGAHHTTLAHKIFLKMKPENPCILIDQKNEMGGLMSWHKADQIFVTGLDTEAAILPKMIQIMVRMDTFTNKKPVWQSPRAMILRKDFPKYYFNYFNYAVTLMAEFGLIDKAFRDFPCNKIFGDMLTDANNRDLFRNFDGLQEYIDAHSRIAPLTLLDLDYLFRLFFLILVSLLVAFLAHWTLVCLPAVRARFASFHRIRRLLRRGASVDIIG